MDSRNLEEVKAAEHDILLGCGDEGEISSHERLEIIRVFGSAREEAGSGDL